MQLSTRRLTDRLVLFVETDFVSACPLLLCITVSGEFQFTENHSLIDQFLEWLIGGKVSAIEKYFMPETRIQQMQHGMLRTADV